VKSFRLIGSSSYRMLLKRKDILDIIDREKPDLIEVGDPYRSAWISWEASRKHGIPIVAFYHSDFPRALGRTIERFCGGFIEKQLSWIVHRYVVDLYNRMDATVVASERLEKILKECGIRNVVRIPLGTNTEIFKPNPEGAAAIRADLGLSPKDTLLLFVGRLAREKNIKSLIEMLVLLNQEPRTEGRYHLLLVGDGELRRYVEHAIHSRSDITWYQYCESPESLTAYYTAADLFVHAGRFETFGITSLEAQACGTRVLAIRMGGLDDTVAGEDPLIMAESSAPEVLAHQVKVIVGLEARQTPEERRERIRQNLTTQLLFARLTGLYEHLLQGKPIDEFDYRAWKCETDNVMEGEALYTP
jgi:alpha-1,6-mannosyltransferase